LRTRLKNFANFHRTGAPNGRGAWHRLKMKFSISMQPPNSHTATGYRDKYWPEIDGLRTVAVASVFAFHLDPRLLRGGFVGVDIFFVISGYLITGLLLKDFESGYSILRFYQRRVARIAPASFLIVAITMTFGFLLYSAQDFASIGATGLAATLSFINIKLLFQGNYFKISPDAQPLIHYWSLVDQI
jgi:peptidoglycan/LPS O-acetylase OafA/YrhL